MDARKKPLLTDKFASVSAKRAKTKYEKREPVRLGASAPQTVSGRPIHRALRRLH